MVQKTKLHPFHKEVANLIKEASTASEVAAIRSTLEVLNDHAEAKLRILGRKEKLHYNEEAVKDFVKTHGPNLAAYFKQWPEIAYTTQRTVENLIFCIHQHFPNQKFSTQICRTIPGGVNITTKGLYFDLWTVSPSAVGWPSANICCHRTNSDGACEAYSFWWASDAIKALVQGESCTDIIAAKEEEDGC